MIAEQLKKSILQAAIQGKFTQQLPEDGDARDLLKDIQKEKARLIKEGKIKKEKPLPEITEDEIPFEIPENWCLVRLAECLDVRDGTHDSPKYVSNGVPLVTSKNINGGKLDLENTKLISRQDANKINIRSKVDPGDILFAMIGSIGNPVLIEHKQEFCIKNVALFKNINNLMCMKFMLLFFEYIQFILKKEASGGVQSFISLNHFRNFLVPLPPEAEQQRIVGLIEELLPEIESLKNDEVKLEELQKSFPKKMKDSILQYAIQGKLTHQLPEDGDARDLLKDIRQEKARLIKEGKIKKEKPLPEITEDEIPFEIPENWCWVRLGEIVQFMRNGASIKQNKDRNGYPITRIETIAKRNLDREKVGYANIYDARYVNYYLKSNDILMSHINSDKHLGKTAIVFLEKNEVMIHGMNLLCLRLVNSKMSKYTNYFFNSPFFLYEIKPIINHAINQASINTQNLSKMIMPMPPIVVQEKIVKRLEEILPVIDKLKNYDPDLKYN